MPNQVNDNMTDFFDREPTDFAYNQLMKRRRDLFRHYGRMLCDDVRIRPEDHYLGGKLYYWPEANNLKTVQRWLVTYLRGEDILKATIDVEDCRREFRRELCNAIPTYQRGDFDL